MKDKWLREDYEVFAKQIKADTSLLAERMTKLEHHPSVGVDDFTVLTARVDELEKIVKQVKHLGEHCICGQCGLEFEKSKAIKPKE